MTTAVQGLRITDWLALEEENRFSRDNVTVAAGQTLVTGQLVKADGSGNAIALTAVTDTPLGIICKPITTGATTTAGAVVSREARVVLSQLTFGVAATDPQKLVILGKLNTVITVREA